MKYTIVILSLFFFFTQAYAGDKIYKYTDADGNIHYSDTKPHADAKEAKLKGISIVESTDKGTTKKWKSIKKNSPKSKGFNFKNFKIASPQDDETIWGTGGDITVSVDLSGKLPSKYRIKFFLDNIPHGKVKQGTQLIADVERGEHTLYAQVIEANSRKVVKTSATVKFYVKQHSKK